MCVWGGNIPFCPPPITHPTFSSNACETVKTRSQKSVSVSLSVPSILFEEIAKSTLFNSFLNFAILSVFNMRNIINIH